MLTVVILENYLTVKNSGGYVMNASKTEAGGSGDTCLY